ncbi:hypothetical protein R6Q57_009965 [Mikania cordata]
MSVICYVIMEETGGMNLYMGILIRCQRAVSIDNITDEMNKAKSASGGDDTPVDEVEVLEMSPQTYLPICVHQEMNFNNNWQKQMRVGRNNNASTKQCKNRSASSCRCKVKNIAHLITSDDHKMKMKIKMKKAIR